MAIIDDIEGAAPQKNPQTASSSSSQSAGSATHDWDDSVLCRCFQCDSCGSENRVDKNTYPKFCNQCGIGFDELKF